MQEFIPSAPCASSELVHFRNRIGAKGVELIFQESIRVNNEDDDEHHHDTAFIDSTVQEKNITYPTDAKLHKKIVRKVLDIVHKLELPLRQSHTFVLKRIYRDQRFRNHPKNRQKALRANRKLRSIAGRLVRELKRNLGEHSVHKELIERFEAILAQRRHSILFTNLRYNASARVKSIRSTNSAIKYPSSARLRGLFLVPNHFVMSMMDTR